MQKVAGIGGLFFRAQAPDTLKQWYADTLGVALTPDWHQQAGPTVFEPFAADTTYFGRESQAWMVNFRVADLAGMVAQLRAAGVTVADPQEYPPAGWFARLHDPEGNPIELWQPPTD